MRGISWLSLLAVIGIAALMADLFFRSKPGRKKSEPPPADPPGRTKALIDGEEVEVESVSEEELERLALAAGENEPEPTANGDDSATWRDVLADTRSVSVRRTAQPSMNIREAAVELQKAGIVWKVAPSSESLLGVTTLQVREADLDRALEVLRSASGATEPV